MVLAGGRGVRMGGVDKGLQLFQGQPLAQHALARLQMQHGHTIALLSVNANRNLASYQTMGVPVWIDATPDEFAGPLAGFLTGLTHCTTPYLLTVPCDTPHFPLDLAQRLLAALQHQGAEIAMASTPALGEPSQPSPHAQPVFCLLHATLAHSLADFMRLGGRKITTWTAQHRTVLVPFDDADAFANANTLVQLQALQAITL
jgi:molybdenum cofactor guanylyltransferase